MPSLAHDELFGLMRIPTKFTTDALAIKALSIKHSNNTVTILNSIDAGE